jgi:hypothetical protein
MFFGRQMLPKHQANHTPICIFRTLAALSEREDKANPLDAPRRRTTTDPQIAFSACRMTAC